MYYLGLDIGSSSIKVALVEASSGKSIMTLKEPENEMDIQSLKNDWAEQNPLDWWILSCKAIKRIIIQSNIEPNKIQGIGISYQMHGLVIVDEDGIPVRNSIIWCDSRAVEIGNKAFLEIGEKKCIKNLLNSPANLSLIHISEPTRR